MQTSDTPVLVPETSALLPDGSDAMGEVVIPLVNLQLQHEPIQSELELAIATVIQRNDFVLGEDLAEFEDAFAHACQRQFGIGVGSGTDAITLGLMACGIGPGDEVIVPANAFAATLIAVLRTGATPVLVDCDPDTALIDLMAAEKAITPRTRAILPVHLYGQMVSPTRLLDLAGTYDLLIFEDAADAPLAEREGYRAGSVGLAAAFSFYPSKNLGAFGDGGIVVTQEHAIADQVRSLRNYGALHQFHHVDLGANSRLDTLQAAILKVKLPHLAAWNAERNRLAAEYDRLLQPLKAFGIEPILNRSGSGHACHLYVIRVRRGCPLQRDALKAALAAQGIETGIHYPVPCHLQPAFQLLDHHLGHFPHAEMLGQQILSLPLYPGLTKPQLRCVVSTMESILKAARSLPANSLTCC